MSAEKREKKAELIVKQTEITQNSEENPGQSGGIKAKGRVSYF
ncbi:hypothetical protein [Neobacillus cucumis]|nr:hypothetical protein [Neobacillus cucumis]